MYRGEFHSLWPPFPWKLTAGIFFSVIFSLIIINIGLTMEKNYAGGTTDQVCTGTTLIYYNSTIHQHWC